MSFPSDYLDAVTLTSVLEEMSQKRKFSKLLFYLEACESGSMFQDVLPSNLSVLAVTASNATSPSFAMGYDERLNTFVADQFSFAWMEDTERSVADKETLIEQMERVAKKIARYSSPGAFGDIRLEDEMVGQFQGSEEEEGENDDEKEISESVVSYNVPLVVREKGGRVEEVEVLRRGREEVEELVKKLMSGVAGKELQVEKLQDVQDKPLKGHQWECYLTSLRHFHSKCFNLGESSWALRQVHVLAALCVGGGEGAALEIGRVLGYLCTGPPLFGID